MSSIPYAPVTCVDGATSIGAADATIVPLDYRFAGGVNYALNFAGTLASVGAADKVQLQVSPDYKAHTAAGAMWVTIDTQASTAFSGSVNGPWTAFRFIKPGDQVAKVVALVAGRNANRTDLPG